MNAMTRPRIQYLTLIAGSLLCNTSSATFLHRPQRTRVDIPWNNVNHQKHSKHRLDPSRNSHLLQLVSRSNDNGDDNDDNNTKSRTNQSQYNYPSDEKRSPLFWSDTVKPIALAIVQAFLLAVLLLTWEDYTCNHTLPSRNRVDLPVSTSWGASTVHGLGFGKAERLQLQQRKISPTSTDDDLLHVPSYNEVMLEHRQERVTRWRNTDELGVIEDMAVPIHTLCQILRSITDLQGLAENYQWVEMRTALHTAPLSQLEKSASSLRKWDPDAVIGFDWGSCAWRHCGALADAQEAVDELDSLLGVLQPYEALFCLDVLERSVRDMLTTVPWQQADTADVQFWKELPVYIPLTSTNVQYDDNDPDSTGDNYIVDEAYVKALFELRVD
jgi:hypothetical protein